MTGPIADLFVGSVSILIGAVLLLSGLLNWEQVFHLRKAAWLESRWGRGRARALLIAVGAALIALGLAIAMGFAPGKA